jgi:hypothetical protein
MSSGVAGRITVGTLPPAAPRRPSPVGGCLCQTRTMLDAAEAGATFFAILEAGTVRGMIQYAEEPEPQYRHASIDVFLDPAVHNRGLGRDAAPWPGT